MIARDSSKKAANTNNVRRACRIREEASRSLGLRTDDGPSRMKARRSETIQRRETDNKTQGGRDSSLCSAPRAVLPHSEPETSRCAPLRRTLCGLGSRAEGPKSVSRIISYGL